MISNPELQKIINSGTLFPSYLISSGTSFSPNEEASEFVKYISCREGESLDPSLVNLYSQRVHPDVLVIEEEKLTLESLTPLEDFLDFKSTTGNPKVVFLKNLETMLPLVQNKLLKSIEESPKDLVFVFTTSKLNQIINTIQSRSYLVPFFKKSFVEGDYSLLSKEKAYSFYKTFHSPFFLEDENECDLVRGTLCYLFSLPVNKDSTYLLSLPINAEGDTLKSFLDKYPFLPLMRALRSFVMDKFLLLLGENVRYNLDYEEHIKKIPMTLSCANKLLAKLKKASTRENSKFNHIWLRGVLLDSK